MSQHPLVDSVARLRESLRAGFPTVYQQQPHVYRTDLARVLDAALPTRRPLTVRQAALLAYIRESIRTRGAAPTFQEIASHFGYRSLASVSEHLDTLEAKGAIRRARMTARGITVLPEASA